MKQEHVDDLSVLIGRLGAARVRAQENLETLDLVREGLTWIRDHYTQSKTPESLLDLTRDHMRSNYPQKLALHVFVDGAVGDCATCGLAEGHRSHVKPESSA